MAHSPNALRALYDISRSPRKLTFACKSANETIVRLKETAPVNGQLVEVAFLSVYGRVAGSTDSAPLLR
jgi:hypothetical protein